jgi:Leucine-rich repeat (LRR) protein
MLKVFSLWFLIYNVSVQIVASDNRIKIINISGLAKLPSLSCLDLSNNNIDNVPSELGLLENIKALKLEGLITQRSYP